VTDRKRSQLAQPGKDEQLARLLDQGQAGPGVVELMNLYEETERIYSSTVAEPRIWYATSTS